MRTVSSKWAGGILLSLLFAPPAAADLFSYTGGSQTFTAPVDGVYAITAYGASGGSSFGGSGGLGAEVGGQFTLTAGEILEIYVGGVGASVSGVDAGAGGGGGAFVVDSNNNPLVVAGGGGGGGGDNGRGLRGRADSGNGRTVAGESNEGTGGGGFSQSAEDSLHALGGSGFPDLDGGISLDGGGDGGYGGGGGGTGTTKGGGGGGGYSGGAGGFSSRETGGVGGLSFDSGLDQVLSDGENSGNGKVDIELVQATVPEPASCLLFGTLLVGVCAGLRKRSRSVR